MKRSPGAYSLLAEAESQPLPEGPLPELETFGHTADPHPKALEASVAAHPLLSAAEATGTIAQFARAGDGTLSAGDLAALAMAPGSSSLAKHSDGSAIDAGGLVPDVATVNSWTQTVGTVDPLELLEVQLCNTTAPFILIDRLRPSLAAAAAAVEGRRSYVVNVSAMEGVFGRQYKGPSHPHTNMAKAALNMLTRTSSGELFSSDGILMISVDTGWITDERPHHTKVRLAEEGFHAPARPRGRRRAGLRSDRPRRSR